MVGRTGREISLAVSDPRSQELQYFGEIRKPESVRASRGSCCARTNSFGQKSPMSAERNGILLSSMKRIGSATFTRHRARLLRPSEQAIASRPKVLLTATPLQNSLMELYGLVSIIDGYAFGDAKSFSTRYVRRNNADSLAELKARLAPICKRTLRRQVLEYIKYTNRHALVQEFIPSRRRAEALRSCLRLFAEARAARTAKIASGS